ncbi:MAG: hypothetical protein PHG66_00560 [Candidatus Colwellbacteria bacterium]|nr:hypothetical protein [Candidatus Colwellbacteria bacterium]
MSELSIHEIAQARFLINSLYVCRVCFPLKNNGEGLDDFPPRKFDHTFCRQYLEKTILSSVYPVDINELIQSYTTEKPMDSFFTTPALPSQGLIECYILKTDIRYELYLNVKNSKNFRKIREEISKSEEESIYTDRDFEKNFPLVDEKKKVIKTLEKRAREYGEDVIKKGDDIFLLCSRKKTRMNGIHHYIYSDKNYDDDNYVADLHANFYCNKFSLYNNFKQNLLNVSYSYFYKHHAGSPIRIEVAVPNSEFTPEKEIEVRGDLSSLHKAAPIYSKSLHDFQPRTAGAISIFDNQVPVWNNAMGGYVMHFDNLRVKETSVKNFKLNRTYTENGISKTTTILQFGRVLTRRIFVMDYGYPMSPLMAFGICLSAIQKHYLGSD